MSSPAPRTWAWLALALVATALVHARALSGELVYDDLLIIGRNPTITSLANLPTLLTSPYWDFLEPGTSEQIGYWRPLTSVAHALAWALGNGAPWAFHLGSLVAHLVATAAAFLLVRRLSGSDLVAGGAALLFGLHPTHVESVAWISALNDPLFGAFSLLALAAYLRWRDRGSVGWPLAAALLLALGLGSKEMAVAVVPMCVALDLARRRGPDEGAGFLGGLGDWKRAYAPFAVVIALYMLARVFVFGSLYAGFDRTPTTFRVPWTRELLLRVELLGGSVELLAWPQRLNAFRPFVPNLGWGSGTALLAMASIVAATLLGLVLARRRARLALGALLFVPLGLSPIFVNVGSLGRFPLSDRFLYVPVLGATLLVALALGSRLPRRAATLALAVLAAASGWWSWERIGVWRDERTLFTTAVRENPRDVYVRWGLGRVLLEEASTSGELADVDRARRTFEAAGELLADSKHEDTDVFATSEDFLQVNLGLAQSYLLEAELDEYGGYGTPIAILEDLARRIGELRDEAREARERGLLVIEPHLDLSLVYTALGSAHRLAGDAVQAEDAYRKALSLRPRNADAHMGLGRLRAADGDWPAAERQFREALEQQPGDVESRLALAQVLRESGQTDRAEALALELLEAHPELSQAALILASNRLEERKGREALVWIDRALQADDANGHAWYLKAMGLQIADPGGSSQATVEAFQRAAALDPRHFLTAYNFGNYLLRSGATEAALPHLVRAYALAEDPRAIGQLATLFSQVPGTTAADLWSLARADVARGRPDQAETWLDAALALEPDHAGALREKAGILARQGRDEESVALLRRITELQPRDFGAHLELAQALRRIGELGEAQGELELCLELERPAAFSPEDFERALQRVHAMLAEIRAELPSTEIGPRPRDG